MKAMTLRLPDDQAAALELVARVDGTTITATTAMVISDYLKRRLSDPELQDRLQQIMDADRDLARRVSGSAQGGEAR